MTTDGLALYDAILDQPADDVRRLVFADWLEEHNRKEEADWIRKSIADGSEMSQTIAGGMTQTYRRGFVYRVDGQIGRLAHHAARLFCDRPIEQFVFEGSSLASGLVVAHIGRTADGWTIDYYLHYTSRNSPLIAKGTTKEFKTRNDVGSWLVGSHRVDDFIDDTLETPYAQRWQPPRPLSRIDTTTPPGITRNEL